MNDFHPERLAKAFIKSAQEHSGGEAAWAFFGDLMRAQLIQAAAFRWMQAQDAISPDLALKAHLAALFAEEL